MLSSHTDTKIAKWLRNNPQAAAELGLKGNEVNLSMGDVLTAKRNTPIPQPELKANKFSCVLKRNCCIKSICYCISLNSMNVLKHNSRIKSEGLLQAHSIDKAVFL